MANREFHQVQSYDRGVRILYGRVAFGAASIASQDCLGFSVARDSAGIYTVTLADKYNNLLFADAVFEAATTGVDAFIHVSDVALSSRTFKVRYITAAAGGSDPASGSAMMLAIHLRNTSVPRKGV
jgi:hypothetical protein